MKKAFSYLLITACCCAKLSAQKNLQYFVEKAKENSPLIDDNLNQSRANGIEAERLRAFYTKPQIGLVASYMFSPILSNDQGKTKFQPNVENANHYYGYDLAYSNGGTYQAMATITKPLFNEKSYETAREQLHVNSLASENTAKLSAHDLEKIVGDQYILCIQDKMLQEYVDTVLNLLSQQKEILQKLVQSGIYRQSDLTLLNIERKGFVAQQTAFKANYCRDLLDLNILCGIEDTNCIALPHSDLTLSSPVDRSSFLEKYRLDSLNIAAQRKMFELKYRPQVSLFGNAGLNAVYAPTILQRFGLSAGISLTYNLFDGGQKDLNRNKLAVQHKTVSLYKHNFLSQNAVRKNKILQELSTYVDRLREAEQQLNDYKTLLSVYKKEILSGQMSIVNYINTLKNMLALHRDYTLLFAQKQSLINAYNYWNW
ncbi:TolC family protein [Marinilongibacter aquaticus]|uniref:TolC family protein n=1 Tax=Marinilongibacter aquaticus TaxID=2975157 RepID=UPI0021BD64D2|nr:TolC family protein [Marinilongibacter aquaticus]UBM58679.1 TolC family protein [Marinilongibacter aquaticus]